MIAMRKKSSPKVKKAAKQWVLFAVTKGPQSELRCEELALLKSEAEGRRVLESDQMPEGEYAIVPLSILTVRFAKAPRIVTEMERLDKSVVRDARRDPPAPVLPADPTTWPKTVVTPFTGPMPPWTATAAVGDEPPAELPTDDEGYLVVPEGPKPSPLFHSEDAVPVKK